MKGYFNKYGQPRSCFIIVLFSKQEGKCYYCKCDLTMKCEQFETPHVDHKIPKSSGGTNEISNLALTCASCNISKGKKSESEFIEFIQPVVDGKCERKDLGDYRNWFKLNSKYGNN